MTMTEKVAENSGHQVFISHAREKDDSPDPKINRQVVDIICSALESEGITYWIDDQDIDAGDKFTEEIRKAITKSKVMVLIVSSDADKSNWVKKEVHYAENLDLYIVPFSIRETCPEEYFEFFLIDHNWIYSSPTPSKSDLDRLIKAIRRHLGKEPEKPADIIEKPPATAKERIQEPGEIPIDLEAVKSIAQRVYKNENGFWEADYGDGIIMVYIPAGEFKMGQKEEEKQWLIDQIGKEDYNKYFKNELPIHTVYLDGYWMGKTEVTVKQFRIFVEAKGYKTDAEKSWGAITWTGEGCEQKKGITWKNPGFKQDDNHPVVCTSRNDVRAYCEWLSNKRGLSFKLPTEAQWEKAARGTDIRKYPWGNHEPFYNGKWHANYAAHDNWEQRGEDGFEFTSPVGSYPQGASPYGLLDMAGNVWEWCEDWHEGDYYKKSPIKNPKGPEKGNLLVKRGGSWSYKARYLRCAQRGKAKYSNRYDYVGFRLCQNI